VMFMLIRHLDHINDDRSVRTLIQGAISHVKKAIKKRGQTDIELKTLWLSNTLRLLHCLKQYSGETQFQEHSTDQQVPHCLRNFDLSAYRRVLSDIAVWIYQGITKVTVREQGVRTITWTGLQAMWTPRRLWTSCSPCSPSST